MDSPAPPYTFPCAGVYRQLPCPDSTRVLTVFECDEEDDDIECHLAEIRLSTINNDSEGYTALSYTWGAQKYTHEIWIGDQRLLIGANLDSALRHLRRRDKPIRLWVDAVCINQEDLMERNHQVQQMRSIFSAASETVIWLGKQDGGNTAISAWNFLERHSSWALNEHQERDERLPARLQEDLLSFRGELRDVEIGVLRKPWFRRLWVFQEAVVSRNLSIQCGHRRVGWDDFCRTVVLAVRHHDRYGFSMRERGKRDVVRDMNHARSEYLRHHGLDKFLPSWQLDETSSTPSSILNIVKLLHRGRHLEASDSRDKIFGFLGVATNINTDDPRFAVDYRLSPRSLYTIFAGSIIQASLSYDILSYVDSTMTLQTPSWVPNWDGQSLNHLLYYHSNLTILDTLPTETVEETETRKTRVAESRIAWSRSECEADCLDAMTVPGRILGRLGDVTKSITLDIDDELSFQHARSSVDDDSQRFNLVMALWGQKLLRAFHGLNYKKMLDFVNRAKVDGVPWERLLDHEEKHSSVTNSRNLARQIWPHLKQAAILRSHLAVQRHLYCRGRVTAHGLGHDISGEDHFMKHIIDETSIVDGRSLAVCKFSTRTESGTVGEGEGQLALVPSGAEEGDIVIQISGARVPYVVRPRIDDWSDIAGTTNMTSFFEEGQIEVSELGVCPWRFVGDCVLNGFEELPEDMMDMRFELV